VRDADGWRELRNYLLTTRAEDIQREALGQLAIDLAGVSHDCWRFFEALFLVPAHVSTVRALARRLDVLPSTLMSRFFRAHLPSPKSYLAAMRLVHATLLFERPGYTVADVAYRLDYSSPQSFGRHVRMLLDMTALQMRESYDGRGMFELFRASLVIPHLEGLRRLRPLAPTWGSPLARNVVH
jgi:AraC-like DNA-binding protein